MAFVVVQTRDQDAFERAAQYPNPVPVRRCESADGIRSLARDPGALAFVVDVLDRQGRPMAPAIRTIRDENRQVPILVWCPRHALRSAELANALRAGPNGLFVQEPGAFEERSFVQLIPRGALPFHEWLTASIERVTPTSAVRLVSFCLHPANAGSTAEDVARHFRMARRTLSDHLARAKLPPARELLGWASLLAAAWDLEHTEQSAEAIALSHGFASASSFRSALLRWTNHPPSDLREPESFGWTLRCFERRVRSVRRQRAD